MSELRNSGFSFSFFFLFKFPSYTTHKFPSNEKLAMTSQFDLTQFYDIIIRNSDF